MYRATFEEKLSMKNLKIDTFHLLGQFVANIQDRGKTCIHMHTGLGSRTRRTDVSSSFSSTKRQILIKITVLIVLLEDMFPELNWKVN